MRQINREASLMLLLFNFKLYALRKTGERYLDNSRSKVLDAEIEREEKSQT